ncbi:MAG: prolyl oligopeptidase family serine peptidase [Clostridiales bacterium]|nr:prolyl oligopeptidase family serine peptidase [Clostridiales bacterium]
MGDLDIIQIIKIRLGEIPCLYIKPKFKCKERSAVIYYHGWSSKKENGLFIGKVLTFHGHEVIIPDAIYHGERKALDKYNVEAMKKYFWDVIINTVKEYDGLITGAAELLETDRNKVAVMGSSMGGFIASGVFAVNKEIKCLVNMNGACAWKKAESIFKELDRDGKGAASQKQRKLIAEYDPLGKKEDLYPRPILMLHGDADTSVSIEIQRYFYKEVKKLYKGMPERLRLIESSNLNHYKTTGMLEETLKWFEMYL